MSMTDNVRKAMVEAMKAKDKETKDTLSMLLAALGHIVLGHLTKKVDKRLCFLDWGELLAINSEEEYYIQEVEATIFALELLIPR